MCHEYEYNLYSLLFSISSYVSKYFVEEVIRYTSELGEFIGERRMVGEGEGGLRGN